MPKKTVAQAKEWERRHALGATWTRGKPRRRVGVRRGSNRPAESATGIRNCVGLTLQPKTAILWCTTNERDALGDNLVPDYFDARQGRRILRMAVYYMGSNEEPRLKGDRPISRQSLAPTSRIKPTRQHSVSCSTRDIWRICLSAEYVGDGFTMFSRLLDRGFRTGHKIVRVRMKDGFQQANTKTCNRLHCR